MMLRVGATAALVVWAGASLTGFTPWGVSSSGTAAGPERADAVSSTTSPHPAGGSESTVAYRAPVPGPVVVLRGFDPPRTAYGPGHLGVDLRAQTGSAVLAAGAGSVVFAGSVAGRGVVVIAHADGIRTEYEPVSPSVVRGVLVHAGAVIGHVAGRHRSCGGVCLHWGARRGAAYLDPMSLLRPLGPVRLLPWRHAPPGATHVVDAPG